jgi:hypothetical protein
VAHRVEEAVFFGEQPRRHAWVEHEGEECEEVCECYCASDDGEGGVRRRDVIVPGDET